MGDPSKVRVALDLDDTRWEKSPWDLLEELRKAGCTHYKLHRALPSYSGDMSRTIYAVRRAVLPGKSANVLLDDKKFDTPHEAYRAFREAELLQFTCATIHASGGVEMLKRVVASDQLYIPPVAVLVLTSMSFEDCQAVYDTTIEEANIRLARIAIEAKVSHLVSAVEAISYVRPLFEKHSLEVDFECPGVRLSEHSADDQIRVATPGQAKAAGATRIIVGRPIVRSDKPGKEFERYVNAFT